MHQNMHIYDKKMHAIKHKYRRTAFWNKSRIFFSLSPTYILISSTLFALATNIRTSFPRTWPLNRQKVERALCRDRLCKQRLSRPRRPIQEHARPLPQIGRKDVWPLQRQLDRVEDVALDRREAADVVPRDIRDLWRAQGVRHGALSTLDSLGKVVGGHQRARGKKARGALAGLPRQAALMSETQKKKRRERRTAKGAARQKRRRCRRVPQGRPRRGPRSARRAGRSRRRRRGGSRGESGRGGRSGRRRRGPRGHGGEQRGRGDWRECRRRTAVIKDKKLDE